MAEQGTHKPLVESSNLSLGTTKTRATAGFYFYNCLMSITADRLIRTKRRTIALIIERDGSLTVRAPKRATLRDIEQFIQEKEEWIQRTREKLKAAINTPPRQFVDGEHFLFLGTEYGLRLVPPQRPALKFEGGFTLGTSAQVRAEATFIRWYKEQALRIFSERVKHYAEMHGLIPKHIRVTSAKTRWGSCSANGTISFTWRLVMAPLEVIDYVVLHELAHLKVRNHSPRFWKLVESLCPDFKRQRTWLKDHGETLRL